jgi:hypothetical protein
LRLDDLNAQLYHWLATVANARVHATTQRVVNEAFAGEKPALKPLSFAPYRAVLKLERRVSHEGTVSVGVQISPGIIMTPLAKDELTGPRGEGYRRMIEVSVAGRAGTPDEVATVGALLMGPDGGFITGSDFLMDGGVTAAIGSANSLRSERVARRLSDPRSHRNLFAGLKTMQFFKNGR